MRFLADENFPRASIKLLRDAGHDVLSIQDLCPGLADDEVVDMARRENCVLLTLDNDFEQLLFYKATLPCGVVFFRNKDQLPHWPAEALFVLLNKSPALDLERAFTTVKPLSFRQRPL